MLTSFLLLFLRLGIKGVIVVTITINIVGVKFFCSFSELDFKESAASWFWICLTWTSIDWDHFGVNKSSVYHVLVFAMLKSTMIYHSVPDDYASQVDFSALTDVVVGIDQNCQIRDVFSCIWLSRNKELSAFELRIFFKEIDKSVKTIVWCGSIIMNVVRVRINRISNSSWWFKE